MLGICKPSGPRSGSGGELLEIRGDALDPRGPGPKLIVQIVNDKTPNWGGGFSKAARERFPAAQEDFRRWAAEKKANLSLGSIRVTTVGDGTHLASMVAQHGYGASDVPRIRYGALQSGLGQLREAAVNLNATVHMP
ncbi:Appr-1-p processing domain protein, partial [mine drainage metagenome]